MIGIGSFAIMTGLSVPRLRRYHDMGLLVPAHVDPDTGYRSYTQDQVADGRTIARFRQADLPLEELEHLVAGRGDAVGLLRRHRERLRDRITATEQMVGIVDQLIREERERMTTTLQLIEVVLRVDDVDGTVGFYRDVFGMEFQADDHNGALPLHYDACGGSWDPAGVFLFTIYPADGRPTSTNLGFGVPDVDDVWERARRLGAREVSSPTDDGYIPRHAAFDDLASNRVTVYQRGSDW